MKAPTSPTIDELKAWAEKLNIQAGEKALELFYGMCAYRAIEVAAYYSAAMIEKESIKKTATSSGQRTP